MTETQWLRYLNPREMVALCRARYGDFGAVLAELVGAEMAG